MHPLVLALASAGLTGLAAPLWAQEPPSSLPASPLPAGTSSAAPLLADAATLRAVTVSATRTERTIDEVPVTVTVTERADIERRDPRNLKDLLDDEIDLSVRSAPTRFSVASPTGRAGVEGINIRGLEGNQVLMTVDGIRVPNAFSFAAFSTGRGDYVSPDGLKSVEVLRGPASMQFGSDGLAGAVSFRTLDPGDVLQGDVRLGGFARSGYASVDRSRYGTLALAGRTGQGSGHWQGLLLASLRAGHQSSNQGSDDSLDERRTAPNPLDYDSGYVLAKASYAIDGAHQLGATLEALRRTQDTQVYSGRKSPPLADTSVIGLESDDRVARERVSLEHRFADPGARGVQRAQTTLYWQDAQSRQKTWEDRFIALDRTRDNRYQSRVFGFSSVLQSDITLGLPQHLTYGLDWSRASSSALRDGTVPAAGESFPTRPFPSTAYTLAGAFVQSEMPWGAFNLTPGLRLDHYALAPSAAGYDGEAVSLSGSAVSPRLGVLWQLSPAFAPYAQWSRGFRAPTPDQVNNGFSNPLQGYASIGNPRLQAERAKSVEIGARGQFGAWRYGVAAFDNRYRNFIEQDIVQGTGRPGDPMVFQYINLNDARIHGAQLRAEWAIERHWTLAAGVAYTKGYSTEAGRRTPLESVNPLKATLSVRYERARWGLEALAVHYGRKSPSSVQPVSASPSSPGAGGPAFIPRAATVIDVGAHYQFTPRLALQARIGNLLDTTYWRWQDARGLAASSQVLDAYSAPGRNVQLSVKYDF